jgi:hypothetical protein
MLNIIYLCNINHTEIYIFFGMKDSLIFSYLNDAWVIEFQIYILKLIKKIYIEYLVNEYWIYFYLFNNKFIQGC